MKQDFPETLRIADGGPWCFREPPFEFYFEDPHHPLSRRLRKEYGLEEVIAGGQTEMEKFLLLKEWVRVKMIRHGWNFKLLDKTPENALGMLGALENGTLFICGYHAFVFKQCCEALGYPARSINLSRLHAEFPYERKQNIGHVVAEVWSNERRKWIVFDCDANVHYEMEEVALSAAEVCRENHRNGGAQVKPVYGSYRPEADTTSSDGKTVDGTVWSPDEVRRQMGLFMENDVIDYYGIVQVKSGEATFASNGLPERKLQFAPPGSHPPLVRNFQPVKAFDTWTDDLSVFNWSVNETVIKPVCGNPERPHPPLAVQLSHNMPNFDHFEQSRDDGSTWTRCGDSYDWDFAEGESSITARAVNSMGITGCPSRAVVQYRRKV